MDQKLKLAEISKIKEQELENQVAVLAENGKKLATNLAVIAGGLALSYFTYRLLFESKKKSKNKSKNLILPPSTQSSDAEIIEHEGDSLISEIGQTLVKELSLVLLDIAKEKIQEYLTPKDDAP